MDKPGVTITYARGKATPPRIALQMPRFVRSIRPERQLDPTAFAAEHGVTHVFSDNCYGAWAELPGVPNVFLTHQLVARSRLRSGPWATVQGSPVCGGLRRSVGARHRGLYPRRSLGPAVDVQHAFIGP